ncbi:HNH endonuclease family protein [Thalassotalea crassostreae]|uniref:HNH endonuclease family protein n=1 Tax=Thalassotalea crassostreae TaxID=1763536 RepID=UPI000839061A|nr:HNH endonuclease family protein [Thalassotalea crassostreae]
MQKYFVVCLVAVSILFSGDVFAAEIKKSKSAICHSVDSPYYARVKNFDSFSSLSACLNSGGRMPKGMQSPSQSYDQSVTQSNANVSSNNLTYYKRSQFGSGWADLDKDCQNSRMEALVSQSVGPVHFKDAKQCKVRAGKWISPFTGNVIYDASVIDIDHVVPLKWAWDHGASDWSYSQRVAFANDPANLLSVERGLNRQKGAKGVDEWLPPANQCQYISRFMRVMKTYKLKPSEQVMSSYENARARYCA